MDIGLLMWIIPLAAFVGMLYFLYWLIAMGSRNQLIRCPETGGIGVIHIAPSECGDSKASKVIVTQCDLWPQKMDCAQGCLARIGETEPGWRVSRNALRPFEPHSL